MHVVGIVGVRLVEEQLAQRELPRFLLGRRHVVEQCGVDASGDRPDDLRVRVQFAHPAFHSLQHGVAVGLGDLIKLVDHHQVAAA